MERVRNSVKSVRLKLFLTLCIVITTIILLLVLINNVVLEKFYLYNKTKVMKHTYMKINEYCNQKEDYERLDNELRTIAIKNNADIIIKSNDNIIMLETESYRQNYEKEIEFFDEISKKGERVQRLYKEENVIIDLIKEKNTNVNYIVVTAKLDNDLELNMATPTADLQESARISNNVLIAIGGAVIVISGIISSFVSRKFTAPILELNAIAQKMSNLDFSQKYQINDTEDEINNLGKSINTMSDKLEKTIQQLTVNNNELEKDIERKSKIDEMRKQFISDVSHELKTPIALIQGYAEGLIENVSTDEESRRFYAEVILDETNKMDRLVKQLLELMKLEYGKKEFNNEKFDINELINEVIRKCEVMLQKNNIQVEFESKKPIYVWADEFYIEQVVTNYFTNAIKHTEEIGNNKKIKITVKQLNDKMRITVFNTGKTIPEEDLTRIWGRFYKVDSSRNRQDGGTGIGLALVKAIMNNYQNEYGVNNKKDGVEFYFDVDIPR